MSLGRSPATSHHLRARPQASPCCLKGGIPALAQARIPLVAHCRHDECALAARAQFLSSLQELRVSASQGDLAPPSAPLLGVGHSMGSLLHLLMGSYEEAPTESNVLISYNNK